MKALRTTICTYAIVLFANLFATTPLLAGSGDFAGIYAAVRGAAVGGVVDGSYVDSNDEKSTGSGGAVFPIAGVDLGVNIPLGDYAFVSFGGAWTAGSAQIAESGDFEDAADVQLEAGQMLTWYVQPSISVWDNSAIFIKYGETEANLSVHGDSAGGPGNLSGYTLALGTQTISNNGLFMKTEAGASVFDEVTITNIGGQSGGRIHADPFMAYGAVSIGFKF